MVVGVGGMNDVVELKMKNEKNEWRRPMTKFVGIMTADQQQGSLRII